MLLLYLGHGFSGGRLLHIKSRSAHNRSAYGIPGVTEEEATGVALPGGWTLILLADRLIFLFRARLTKSHKPGVSRLTNHRKRAKRPDKAICVGLAGTL